MNEMGDQVDKKDLELTNQQREGAEVPVRTLSKQEFWQQWPDALPNFQWWSQTKEHPPRPLAPMANFRLELCHAVLLHSSDTTRQNRFFDVIQYLCFCTRLHGDCHIIWYSLNCIYPSLPLCQPAIPLQRLIAPRGITSQLSVLFLNRLRHKWKLGADIYGLKETTNKSSNWTNMLLWWLSKENLC